MMGELNTDAKVIVFTLTIMAGSRSDSVELSHPSPCLNTPHDVQATEADGIDVAGLVVAPALGRYDHLDTPLSSGVKVSIEASPCCGPCPGPLAPPATLQ